MQAFPQSGDADVMDAANQFQQALRTRKIHMGEDVLQRLGPEFAVIADWHAGMRSPKIAIVGQVTDADKLRPALDAAMDALKESIGGTNSAFQWDETESATQKLRSLHLGGRLPSPTYTVTDQFFILASNPDYARELLAQAKDPKPTPRDQRDLSNRHETLAHEWIILRLRGSAEIIHVRLRTRAIHPHPNRQQPIRRFAQATAAGNGRETPLPVRLGNRERAATIHLDILFAAGQIARRSPRDRRRSLGCERLLTAAPTIRYACVAKKVFK